MKNLVNKVKLIGYIGMTPKVIEFENGKKVARFSVATTEVYKENGKLQKNTKWHNIVAWDKNAEIAKHSLSIGSEVLIDGRLINKEYKDSNQNIRIISEILAESILFREIKFAITANKNSENIA